MAGFDLKSLLGQQYMSPMQGGMQGAAQAIAPMTGYTKTPVSMGQLIGAAGGGMVQGQRQAQQQNMLGAMQNMSMEEMQNKMAASKAATSLATQQRAAVTAMAAKLGLPANTPANIVMEKMKHQTEQGKYGTQKIVPNANSSTGFSYQQITQGGATRITGEAPKPSSGVTIEAPKLPGIMDVVATDGYKESAEMAALASQKLFSLNEMKSLTATGVPTGRLADASMPLRQMFAGFGVQDANLPLQEAMNSLGNKMALAEHGPGMGPMTDPDFQIYRGIVPGLKNTQAGNALVQARIERQLVGEQMYHQVIKEQVSGGDVKAYSSEKAWREVSKRLEAKLGPLIPMIKGTTPADLAKAEADPALDGKVIMFNGKSYFMRP